MGEWRTLVISSRSNDDIVTYTRHGGILIGERWPEFIDRVAPCILAVFPVPNAPEEDYIKIEIS